MTQTPQPWECPRCHRINAPHTPTCFCKPADVEAVKPLSGIDEYQEAIRKLAETGWPARPAEPRTGDPVWLWTPQNTTTARTPPGAQWSYTTGGIA